MSSTTSNTSRAAARRANAQRLAIDLVGRGDCSGIRRRWADLERVYLAAPTPERAREAAKPLLQLCHRCLIQTGCATWATEDKYTGVAGGQAWINGEPRSTEWVELPRS